ncbi:Zinc carboxypeptidase [Seminavis robusta]|uniref:Zinc carboxypeptidase n=1 Tax=Seminavis robusta TaxID=568900 RepID=A0A9N8ETT9_9STRA|nr:Zinc carboxypeptidase [Seminavis robusta]|eukprot:Sro1854_g301900.1 Zinc carboxypeptidase (805) ;mRNA; f:19037-21451
MFWSFCNKTKVGIWPSLVLFLLPRDSCSQSSVPYVAYKLLTAQQISDTLTSWQVEYPNFVTTHTSQEKFGLPAAGFSYDCPFDPQVDGCLNYYAVVQDYVAHPPGSTSSNRLPTMLLSGELHGNERVGPTAVMEATRILLEAAACQALPRFTHNNDTQWELDSAKAVTCQGRLSDRYGMSDIQQQWLARLVSTRRIIVVPTANALGYYRNAREEGNVDPNRDFPYDHLPSDTDECMRTIAARTMNELFRHYMISNSFTFHGGTELLGYEWGNPTHFGYVSPDDIAQDQLARSYSVYGGSFQGNNGRYHPNYLYGDMNSIIYYVRGGFEDYAYAGSWDNTNMVVCNPNTYGGYPAEKTTYDAGMLRSFNMLAETSWVKSPNDNDLGTSLNVLYENSDSGNTKNRRQRRRTQIGDDDFYPSASARLEANERMAQGHIPRNIRLSIAAIEMIHPYVRITAVDGLELPDDIVPLASRGYSDHPACNNRALVLDAQERLLEQAVKTGALPVMEIPLADTGGLLDLQWTVGGAMTIDQTQLWVAAIDDSAVAANDATAWLQDYICGDPLNEVMSLSQRLEPNAIKAAFTAVGTPQQGTGFFSAFGPRPIPLDDTMGPVFHSILDLASLNVNAETTLVVLASAQVDSSWTQLPVNTPVAPSNTGPQSHMVQVRTNANWKHVNSQGYVVQGQTEFFTEPILIRLLDSGSSVTAATLVNDRFQKPSERPGLSTTVPDNTVTGSGSGSGISVGGVSVNIVQVEDITEAPTLQTEAPTFDGSVEATMEATMPQKPFFHRPHEEQEKQCRTFPIRS